MSKKPHKEPIFLFTSCSLRHAAWAGWYSALGDKENSEKFVHYAYAEWGKEIAAGRRFDFADRFNDGIYQKSQKIAIFSSILKPPLLGAA